jgi:gas vesicle structural protein
MSPRKRAQGSKDWLFPKAALQEGSEDQSSLLDVVDSILNKGAVVNGDLILGVANVDLVYAKLSVLIAALDRIMKPSGRADKKREDARRKRTPRSRR